MRLKVFTFSPHCKSCLSAAILSETNKEWRTSNTSNKTLIFQLQRKSDTGYRCHSVPLLFCWQCCGVLVFCTKGLYRDCWESSGSLWCCQVFCDVFSGVLKHLLDLCSMVNIVFNRMKWMSQRNCSFLSPQTGK